MRRNGASAKGWPPSTRDSITRRAPDGRPRGRADGALDDQLTRMTSFEQPLPDEEKDIAAIVNGILTAQKRFAAAQSRPLARGTHAKGTCVRAQFEVFDLRRTI